MLTRRQFLQLGAGVAVSACHGGLRPPLAAQPSAASLLLAARDNLAGEHFFSGVDLSSGAVRFEHALGYRGHGLAAHAGLMQAVLFARRPGREATVVDLHQGGVLRQFQAAESRHFYGHGCFSADGAWLFTTEHDYAAGRGCIGVRRSSDYQQLAELPSHGMDPHDIRLLADGQTLVVANGGIRTHPDFPRRELDIEHMASSLVYLRADSGALLDQQVLADRYLSMRHLAVLADGRVAVALQDRAPKRQASALLAVSRQQQSLQLLPLPAEQLAALQGYAADVVCDAERGVLAVSAARGNALVLWTYPQADFLTTVPVPDPGGLVVTAEGVQASSGAGGLWQLQTDGHAQQVLSAANYHWDNHALLL